MAALEDRIDDEKRAEGLASDANTMVETPDINTERSDIDPEKADIDAERTDVEADNNSEPPADVLPEDTLSPDDYPKGLQFFFILLALVFSIFMVALDLVGSYLESFCASVLT